MSNVGSILAWVHTNTGSDINPFWKLFIAPSSSKFIQSYTADHPKENCEAVKNLLQSQA